MNIPVLPVRENSSEGRLGAEPAGNVGSGVALAGADGASVLGYAHECLVLSFRSATIILSSMQSLNDDERKELLGEVLADELKAILEYVKDVPAMQNELHQVHATVNDISDRFSVLEHVVKDHESEIKQLLRGAA